MTSLTMLQIAFAGLSTAAAGIALWNLKRLRSDPVVGWAVGIALASALIAQRAPTILLWSEGREASGAIVQRVCPESGNHFLIYQFTAIDGTVQQGRKRMGGGSGECKVPSIGERAPVIYLQSKPEVSAWEGPSSDLEFLVAASILLGLVVPAANQVQIARRADA